MLNHKGECCNSLFECKILNHWYHIFIFICLKWKVVQNQPQCLLASSAACSAETALTRRETLEIPPALKQSTIPWFLLSQYPKSSPVTTSFTLGWGIFSSPCWWKTKTLDYTLTNISSSWLILIIFTLSRISFIYFCILKQ